MLVIPFPRDGRSIALVRSPPLYAQVNDPSFEGGGSGWTTYGGGGFENGNHFGMTADDGNWFWASVRSFSSNGNIEGLFQTITTTPGVDYTLTVAGQAHNRDQFSYTPGQASQFPNDTDVRIGVDLTGGTNPGGGAVQWSTPQNTGAQWADQELDFTASGPLSTIFLESRQQFAFAGNWTGFDNVRLEELSQTEPGGPGGVPEPSSVALWGLIVAGLSICLVSQGVLHFRRTE